VQEYCEKEPNTEFCPALLQVVGNRRQTCEVGDHVECPDVNSTMCSGNQCCPRSTYGKTYPCPSAEQGWSECESPIKLADCLEAHACCAGVTADCLACSAGKTVEEYCAENPSTEGCSHACCRAMTADCLACSVGQSVEEYCAENPSTEGCSDACCLAATADCLACSAGQTVQEYCAENPGTVGCTQACCMAMTADCLACQEGLTVQEYCEKEPNTEFCPALLQVVGNRRQTCEVGDHVECPDVNSTMCSGNQCCPRSTYGKTYPCPSAEQGWSECESPIKLADCLEAHACCTGATADCLACSEGKTVEEYCVENPSTEGCSQACCRTMTADCLACSAGQTVEEYCAENPGTAGCTQACCMAVTAECLACAEGLTEEEYCTKYPSSQVCSGA